MGFNGKRILVTGASGFVGRQLTKELERMGAKVLALDVHDVNPVDIRDWEKLKEFTVQEGNIDLVYHLAALMYVPHSFENPREIYEVNVLGTLNILELSRLNNFGKLVFASSYVYGPPQYVPINEDHPVKPTNPYARSKVLGEALCRAYHEDYGLRCLILRPFNIFGEGQSERFLITSIVEQLASGTIKVADPEPRRDFLYVEDAVDAYLKAGEYANSDFQIINVGSGVSYSVAEVVEEIINAWGREVEVAYEHRRRRNEIMDVVADIQKARSELGWEPKFTLKEGVKRYIEGHKKHLNLDASNKT